MKKLSKYAFLIKHHSYSPKIQHTTLKSDQFTTQIVGVSNHNEAIEVINKLIDKGIELVELCGGFSEEDKSKITKSIKKPTPIGKASLDDENIKLLNTVLQ